MSSFNLCVLKTFCVPYPGIHCCNNKGKCSPTFRTKEGLVYMDSILFKIKCAFSLTTFPHTMLSPKQMSSSYFFTLSEIPTPPTLCQECLKTRNSARFKEVTLHGVISLVQETNIKETAMQVSITDTECC